MAEFSARGVSLWWVPQEPASSVLRGLIDALATAHGGPPFDPHVTVLGQVPGDPDAIVAGAAALASRLQPLELVLAGYGHEEVWTRWLYRFVERTEAVMAAGALARAHFGITGGRPYNPHLSLLYGVFDEAVAAPLLARTPPPERLSCDALVVVSTDGLVRDWQELARFLVGPTHPS